jgi:hypothetical protein
MKPFINGMQIIKLIDIEDDDPISSEQFILELKYATRKMTLDNGEYVLFANLEDDFLVGGEGLYGTIFPINDDQNIFFCGTFIDSGSEKYHRRGYYPQTYTIGLIENNKI